MSAARSARRITQGLLALLTAGACLLIAACGRTPEDARTPRPETKPMPAPNPTAPRAEAVFAGGCFWCVEAVFEELDGVSEAVSGYAGGTAETANYDEVSTGRTGHAEAVKIVYDPTKIDYATLLRVHFATHDPTQLNRQGNDYGPQYRSAIFYSSDDERRIAEEFIQRLNDSQAFPRPVVTTVEALTRFYPAESRHQNYVCNNPSASYVAFVAMPKVKKTREKFGDLLKDRSPLDR